MDTAEDFEQWMKEEEERMKNYVPEITVRVDKRRLPNFIEPIRKQSFEFKRQGQLKLF